MREVASSYGRRDLWEYPCPKTSTALPQVENYTRWVSCAEPYPHIVPLESRTAIFLNSLEDSVFEVVANLGLTSQTELAVALMSLMTEKTLVQNVGIAI